MVAPLWQLVNRWSTLVYKWICCE